MGAQFVDGGGGDTSAGAGGDAPGDGPVVGHAVMCDGVQHLRLWVLVEPMAGAELPGSIVRVENGYPMLAIDGTCTYWMGGGWTDDALGRDRECRTGKLTDAEAQSLEMATSFDDIGSLADCTSTAGQFDVPTRAIRGDQGAAECPSKGARFDAAWMAIMTLAQTLWERGVSVNGSVHLSAAPAGDSANSPAPYAWPLATPLSSFLLASNRLSNVGVSQLVGDPAAAQQLRVLREQYLSARSAQPGLFTNWDGLKAMDASMTAVVYMRDAIPFEDASGLLRF
jgi:hypothetical protein